MTTRHRYNHAFRLNRKARWRLALSVVRSCWVSTLSLSTLIAGCALLPSSIAFAAQANGQSSEAKRNAAAVAQAADVYKAPVGKKPAVVELKLPKGLAQAMPKGKPDYGVKLEVIRALTLKAQVGVKISTSAENKLAKPSSTHQFSGATSSSIDTNTSAPSVDKGDTNKVTATAESISIKNPGKQVLDAVSYTSQNESAEDSKIFAPRRVGTDNQSASTTLDGVRRSVGANATTAVDVEKINQKVRSALSAVTQSDPIKGMPRPLVDTDNIGQQVQKSLVGINLGQAASGVEREGVRETIAVDKPSVDEDAIKEKASVDQSRVDEDAIKEKASVDQSSVDEDAIKEKASVDQSSVDEDAIKEKASVDQSSVDEDAIKEKASVDQSSVDEDAIKEKASVDQSRVDEDAIKEKASVDQSSVDEDAIKEKASVDQSSVDEDAIKEKASVEKPTVDEDAIKKKAKASVDVNLSDKFSSANKSINDRIGGGIANAISGKTGGNIAAKVDGADAAITNSDSIDETLKKQSDGYRDSAATKRSAAKKKVVPAITQDCVKTERKWTTLWTKEECTQTAPNPKSVADNNTAKAEKKTLNDEADADINAAKTIDTKRDELKRTQGGYTSKDTLPDYAFSGGDNVAGSDENEENKKRLGKRAGAKAKGSEHKNNHHDPYVLNHDSNKHRILELSRVLDIIIALEDINASIGYDSVAVQQIATVQGNVEGAPSYGVLPLTTRNDIINASIGDQSLARQMIDQLGSNNRDTIVPNGNVNFSGLSEGGVNASIGYNSVAYHLQSLVSGKFSGADVSSYSSGFVNASIGDSTTSTLRLSVFEGDAGSGKLDLFSAAAGVIVAAIGANSSANFSAASAENVTTKQSVGMNVTAPGAIAASIGSRTSASNLLGSAKDASANQIDVKVTQVLPAIAAAIGVGSEAHNAVAVLRPGVKVGGDWQASVTYGQLTAFALGDRTTALNEIGVISADVSGDIRQNINVGAMLAGTLGINTEATNKIGNVEARVRGNVDTDINILDVNSLSLGLSIGGDNESIYARTLIGNVFAETGSVKKNISIYGPIVNLGVGLVIKIPVIGTLDLSHKGCVSIGNTGPSQC